ncbi:MAG: alpha/beta hydrolase [SAR324 cluster bacterium]|nr:alpha/beta hydrolase [SAR324 cluster bacterium]
MPKVNVNNIEMYYETHGTGFPLIMLMGWTGNIDQWPPELIESLEKHFQVIMVDNRGAGRSTSTDEPFTVEMFADDTQAFMNALGIEQAHILGISLGGMIAQEMALRYPDKVRGLVLGCTFCGPRRGKFFSPYAIEWVLKFLVTPKMTVNETLLYMNFSRDTRDSAVRYSIKAGFKAPITTQNQKKQFMALIRYNSWERLPQIKKPTLVMTGTKDAIVSAENSKILADRIPGATLIRYKKMSHDFYADAPDKVSHDIIEFLEKQV